MGKIYIEIDEKNLTDLIIEYINDTMGVNENFSRENVKIMVKSKQNFRSEWEPADFKAVIEKKI